MKNICKQALTLGQGEKPKLPPMDGAGGGSAQDKERGYLDEIIEKVNGLFEGELSDDGQLVYVNGMIRGSCWKTRH